MTLTKLLLPLITGSFLFASSGASLYSQACKSCHGIQGDKLAMNKSKAIKGMPTLAVENAMADYASGKRNTMSFIKSIKKDFMTKHSKEELHELAEYINKL